MLLISILYVNFADPVRRSMPKKSADFWLKIPQKSR